MPHNSDGALGTLALGARLAVKELNPTVHLVGTRDDAVAHYSKTFPQVTLLATFRDLFLKIGSDFDTRVTVKEINFTTGCTELPTLPHSGIGSWGAALAAHSTSDTDQEWRELMAKARNAWLDMHRGLYLRPVTHTEGQEPKHEPQRGLLRKLFAPRTATTAINRTFSDPQVATLLKALLQVVHATPTVEGLISLYLFPTFGTYRIDWATCFAVLEATAIELGAHVEWSASTQMVSTLSPSHEFAIDCLAPFGAGPHVELMNAELQAASSQV